MIFSMNYLYASRPCSPREDWYGVDVPQWLQDILILTKNVSWQNGQRQHKTPLETGLMATSHLFYAGHSCLEDNLQANARRSVFTLVKNISIYEILCCLNAKKWVLVPIFFKWNGMRHSGAANVLLSKRKIQLSWIFYHFLCALYWLVLKIMAVTFACTLLLVTKGSFTTLSDCQETFMLPKQ